MNILRRIIAVIGIILLAGLYVSTLVFALMDSPGAKDMLMASIYCTIAVPVLLFAMSAAAKAVAGRGTDTAQAQKQEPGQAGKQDTD